MNELEWPKVLNNYFGNVVTRADSITWHKELTESDAKINGLQDEEIGAAVRWAIGNPKEAKSKGKPTLKDIRIWIFCRRKQESGMGDKSPARDENQFVNRLFFEMRNAAKSEDWNKAWNILCDPKNYVDSTRDTTVPECQELERRFANVYKFNLRDRINLVDPSKAVAEAKTDTPDEHGEDMPI